MAEPTPVPPLGDVIQVPALDLGRIRGQFKAIWQKNVAIVTQTKIKDNEAGNYGSDDEETVFLVNKEIRLNIQGAGTDAYTRAKYGIDTTSKSWHCYALYTEDFSPTDKILWKGNRFIIKNLTQNTYGGERVSWEFDMQSVDKDTVSYTDPNS